MATFIYYLRTKKKEMMNESSLWASFIKKIKFKVTYINIPKWLNLWSYHNSQYSNAIYSMAKKKQHPVMFNTREKAGGRARETIINK